MTFIQPRVFAGSGLLLVAFALAGCAPATTPSVDSSPSASQDAVNATPGATQAATPTPTPTATAQRPKLADLVVSPTGVGAIHIGEKVASEPKSTAIAVWGASACLPAVNADGTARKPGDAYAGKWVVQYPDGPSMASSTARPPFDIKVLPGFKTGAVSYLFVWSSKLSTAKGIHVGSTLAELKAAYPTFTTVKKADLSDVYVIDGGTGHLALEVSKNSNRPGYWPKSDNGRVLWMTISTSSTKPAALAGLDGAGAC